MGVAGWMEHTGAGIGNVGYDADKVEVVHKLDSIITCTLQTKGYDATAAVRHILLGKGIVFVRRQSAVVDP